MFRSQHRYATRLQGYQSKNHWHLLHLDSNKVGFDLMKQKHSNLKYIVMCICRTTFDEISMRSSHVSLHVSKARSIRTVRCFDKNSNISVTVYVIFRALRAFLTWNISNLGSTDSSDSCSTAPSKSSSYSEGIKVCLYY